MINSAKPFDSTNIRILQYGSTSVTRTAGSETGFAQLQIITGRNMFVDVYHDTGSGLKPLQYFTVDAIGDLDEERLFTVSGSTLSIYQIAHNATTQATADTSNYNYYVYQVNLVI